MKLLKNFLCSIMYKTQCYFVTIFDDFKTFLLVFPSFPKTYREENSTKNQNLVYFYVWFIVY